MAWVYLIIAGIFETVWAVGLKYTEGLTRLWPTVGTGVAMLISVYFLSEAVKVIPVGTAYAVWTGIGAFGTAVAGILILHEPAHAARIFFLFLLVVSIVGLKVFGE